MGETPATAHETRHRRRIFRCRDRLALAKITITESGMVHAENKTVLTVFRVTGVKSTGINVELAIKPNQAVNTNLAIAQKSP